MKPRLTEQQVHILKLLNTGWQIGIGSVPGDRTWIQKGGAGRGGESETLRHSDVDALREQRLVYRSQRSFPTSTIDITDAGVAFIEDRWTDDIHEKVKKLLDEKGEPVQVMPGDIEPAPTEHPSYGQIHLSHVSGSESNLYGTSIPHSHTVRLTISRSSIIRHDTYEHHHSGQELIEIEMSPDQLMTLLFNANHGDGACCTLKAIQGKPVKECPHTGRSILSEHFKKTIEAVTQNAETLRAEAERILKTPGAFKASDKSHLLDILNRLVMDVRSNLPFVETQFQEQIDKSMREAESQLAHRANVLGLTGGTSLQALK